MTAPIEAGKPAREGRAGSGVLKGAFIGVSLLGVVLLSAAVGAMVAGADYSTQLALAVAAVGAALLWALVVFGLVKRVG